MNRRRAMLMKAMYAVPYNITYDLNGGSLAATNPSTYTIETSEFTLNSPTRSGYTFLGWTVNEGNEHLFTSPFNTIGGDRHYIAHWDMDVIVDEDFSNNISDLTIDSGVDDDGDGQIDNYSISFVGGSYMEKINLPLNNLVSGQPYRLSFVESNNATSGQIASGYKATIFGCCVRAEKATDGHNILKTEITNCNGLIAQKDQTDGITDIIVIGDTLNGPRNMSIDFTATATTMYWVWDYGLMADGELFTYNLNDISVIPIVPKIDFSSMSIGKPTSSAATFTINSYDEYDISFNYIFDGDSGCEIVYYPITGLVAGTTYSITVQHSLKGSYINAIGGTYDYGCGIVGSIDDVVIGKATMSTLSSKWISNTWRTDATGTVETFTLTFTPSSDTAYWVWNMANVSDGVNATIEIDVAGFKASHKNGGSIDYL